MRTFHNKVAIQSSAGAHVRYVPSALAQAMVSTGAAAALPGNGRVRAVSLARPASGYALRVGEPTAAHSAERVRFTRWVRLDQSAARVIEHHPRCLYIDCDAD